ncbi:MAG TPA: glycerol-3-phosphate acyltransferase [Rhodospirillaceae bacterium]|nr:glycerol-3-phosphate acyltransferase [Candidatus Neomarinimicrobiota bacterium]HCX13938.1 glycerol-3-phosphate acyltransferase [Rhodospirillaceae bacterium]
MVDMQRIGVIGAGAWGTALATVARRAGRDVTLWALEPEVTEAINSGCCNTVYLPDIALDPSISATGDLGRAAAADVILLVVPAQFLRSSCKNLAPHIKVGTPVVICAKGIERGTSALMTDVVLETLPTATIMVLSGPTFAREVASGRPTAITLAAADKSFGLRVAAALSSPTFRPYLSDDVIGAEVGGAVKNVLAIGCGMTEGKGLGANARAALLTRGLAEIVRLSVARGGRAETLMGLSGLGDLVLTATSSQSRNYSLGVALGEGKSLNEVLGARRSVTEGVATAEAVASLAAKLKVDMPICAAINQVLNHSAAIDDMLKGLLNRPLRHEVD